MADNTEGDLSESPLERQNPVDESTFLECLCEKRLSSGRKEHEPTQGDSPPDEEPSREMRTRFSHSNRPTYNHAWEEIGTRTL
jgi:hypothetical protein